ncbi:efflux RND transporter periplasmic adaptor subunit [Afifella sp. IM 167]|uniref:efflux RND transporter periplasmic adaptor subunit n=1 Tax=Afifella sp. IM 167 TaxID=2033586 RepID=UPI001CCFE957|nr:efflux RND transporter periplasmic adaptor subunit [Afifella sp. IM 167]MBZ8134227.1 efflux transporter periplasmic adaptor subunit [Afifella sp. IM 167]
MFLSSRRGVGCAVLFLGLALAAPPIAGANAAEFTVEPQIVQETKAVFGQVESRDAVSARARIGGTIQEISVDEGSQVEEGEKIAVIVDDKLAIERDAAEAKVKALDSQLANARTELERAQQLRTRGTGTQARLDQAQTEVEVLTNQLVAAEADRSVIDQRSREGDVLAPASGRVLDVPVTRGSVILAGEEIAKIAGGGYFLRLSLPERHAAEIVEGDTVKVGRRLLAAGKAKEGDNLATGRLVKVYPEITAGKVEADVELSDLGDYFVGERTLVWIPVGRREVLAVPPAAIITRHGIDYVRIETGDGPIEVAVILGERFEGEAGETRVEVLSGLRAGDRVLVP